MYNTTCAQPTHRLQDTLSPTHRLQDGLPSDAMWQVSRLRLLEIPLSNHEPQVNCYENFHALSHIFEAHTEIEHAITEYFHVLTACKLHPIIRQRKILEAEKMFFVKDEVTGS